MKERKPAVAGSFYPAEPAWLREMINEFLEKANPGNIKGELKGIVVPHAGFAYSGPVAAFGYKLLKEKKGDAKKVFLVGPSHFAGFLGVAQDDSDCWETPLGRVNIGKVPETELIKNDCRPHMPEHCLEVQLPFLQAVLKDFTVYAHLMGKVDCREYAEQLNGKLDKDSILVISSDLSHYHPYLEANKIDSVANKEIPKLNYEKVEGFVEACGKGPILTIIELARMNGWKAKLLEYKNSGDTSGMKDQVVGYGCYAFYK